MFLHGGDATVEAAGDHAWVAALRRCVAGGRPAVLVTVARVDGSAPREPGARMVVTRDACAQTIGGGNLEWRAIETARGLLDAVPPVATRRLVRLALGPSLGQCCGGVVVLAFERIDARDAAWLTALADRLARGQGAVREISFAPRSDGVTIRDVDAARPMSAVGGDGHVHDGREAAPAAAVARHDDVGRDDDAARLIETIVPACMPVFLFGAGHVGAALARVLVGLPCTLTWVDERDALFPPLASPALTIENVDAPESVIARAPAGAYFLVMTHSHALDERLAECILRRDDHAYFGLIGSVTKRRLFERRLAARRIGAAALARMVCPIGIAGIRDKRPESIAVAVAAQLLQAREARATRHASTAIRLVFPNPEISPPCKPPLTARAS